MQSKKQLFCFPFAGGSASFFDRIEKDLPDFDVVKLEYAGHGTRHREALSRNFDELANDMYARVRERCAGTGYALFGYSMGTISLVEVLKRILDRKEVFPPKSVFLAAHEPLTREAYRIRTGENQDDWVKERTIRFGSIPAKLLSNESFWRMYLPLYRADYTMIGQYRFEDLRLASSVPATVFYSETDTRPENMLLWKKIFVGDCAFYKFDGNHFFIREHHEEMARIIRKRIAGRENNDV